MYSLLDSPTSAQAEDDFASVSYEQFKQLLTHLKNPSQEIRVKKDGDKFTELVFVFKAEADKMLEEDDSIYVKPLGTGNLPSDYLVLDGSWELDGSQNLDGFRNG